MFRLPMFIDGVPVLSFRGYEDTLQNIERVEVLRGPQGTLYGKSAERRCHQYYSPGNQIMIFVEKISVDGGEDYNERSVFKCKRADS